ncbi:hypothetical protein BDM02DRAFT_3121075 [Thelephora ganbajun]|uniref:Uncharacterized protein n=1 Tax=Thelephora ganbajun TaxID=370292 RepID=A0ACB6Z5D9_THEGA|nr:hypothetical protein BDM02DRAFT_3121075 [Thelephora ganbajun]
MDAEGVTGATADENAHADVEDLDKLEGVDGGLLNIGVCEVEVESDEEGLIATDPTGYVAELNGIHSVVGLRPTLESP